MANRYWVGGTASWDGTVGTKWALTSGGAGGEAVPTSADDVFFDGNSGAGTVTIASGNAGAKSITCTGFTGTLTIGSAISVAGNVTLVTGMTVTGSGTLSFTATATLITAGKTIGPLSIAASGGTVTLGDAVNTSFWGITVSSGTFDTAGFNVTTGALTSTGSSVRGITLGASNVTLNGSIQFTGTNLTFNAGTSLITVIILQPSLTLGGKTFYDLTCSSACLYPTFVTSAVFRNLTFNAPASSRTGVAQFDANQTIDGTFTVAAGANGSARRLIASTTPGTVRTLTAATTDLTDADFMDITGAGAAGWSGTRLGNAGNNSGITFAAAKTVYYSAATAGTFSSTNWATTSGGATSGNNFPLPQDTAIIDNNSGTGTLTLQGGNDFGLYGAIDASARTTALTINQNSGIFLNSLIGCVFVGSLTLSSSITISGTGTNSLLNRTGALLITSSGKTWTQTFIVSSFGATVRLVDAFSLSSLTHSNGTLDLDGKTLTVSTQYTTASGTKNLTFNGGTVVCSGTGTAWSNSSPTNFTTTAGTGTGKISMTAATAKTFAGGGSTYNCTLSNDGAGALTITGSNTFTTLANGVQPTTFTFTAGTTTTLTNWNISGTDGNLVVIGSATSASHTLSKSSGTVNANFLSISRSTATGGAVWNAGSSVDGGNNTGWVITAASGAGGRFLVFF
jgi:fibronectin-binding autotransporter adhesin